MTQAKPRKYKFKAGEKIHSWTLIQRVRDDVTTRSPNLKIQWRVECVCGKRLTLPIYYLVRQDPKKHCGCLTVKSLASQYKQEYRIWHMMHVRTEDPTHVAYHHYGGRGIRVCPEWHKSRGEEGFRAFLEFVGPRPSISYSIDRVDNDLGYQPYQRDGSTRQVRWATATQQRANQRKSTSLIVEQTTSEPEH